LEYSQSLACYWSQALTPIKLRQKAAKFAKQTVDSQRDQFKRCVSLANSVCSALNVCKTVVEPSVRATLKTVKTLRKPKTSKNPKTLKTPKTP
jgi:hypothetical protein